MIFFIVFKKLIIPFEKEIVPGVTCSESMWNLLGVPWGQALQGDQNLRWDLAHQQGRLNHEGREGPI